jgi:hypothetical protein
MKNKPNFTSWQNGVLTLVTAVLLFSCSNVEPFSLENDDVLRSQSSFLVSTAPGNGDCPVGYQETSGRIDYVGNSSFDASFPGFEITVENNRVSWKYTGLTDDDDNKLCLDGISFVVKGGPDHNIFTYPSGVTEGEVFAPVNRKGNPADLSNLTLCYNTEVCDNNEVCGKETAWVQGTRYQSPGNWAMYATIESLLDPNGVKIFAGQNKMIGTVKFTVDGGGYIAHFSLTGAELQNTKENVKIQGYEFAPTSNPAPGQFQDKFKRSGSEFNVPVTGGYLYYGIHLDASVFCD